MTKYPRKVIKEVNEFIKSVTETYPGEREDKISQHKTNMDFLKSVFK